MEKHRVLPMDAWTCGRARTGTEAGWIQDLRCFLEEPSLEITWIDCYCTLLIFFSAKINSELSLCDSEVVTVPGTFHDGGLWRVCHWAKSV